MFGLNLIVKYRPTLKNIIISLVVVVVAVVAFVLAAMPWRFLDVSLVWTMKIGSGWNVVDCGFDGAWSILSFRNDKDNWQ